MVLPTCCRITGDGIVSDEVWDETVEELFFNSSIIGNESDILEDCE